MSYQLRELQIELAGMCNASCSYCTWKKRSLATKKLMDTDLAKKLIASAKDLGVELVTFHSVGESTLHPNLVDILACASNLGLKKRLSTNCHSLRGDLTRALRQDADLHMCLSLHYGLEGRFLETCLENAENYVSSHLRNWLVQIVIVCGEEESKHFHSFLSRFLRYAEHEENVYLFFKQPVTWPDSPPVRGVIPSITHPKVIVDTIPTPMSIGHGCQMPEYLLSVQADGTCAPCCVATGDWGLPRTTGDLRPVWESPHMEAIRAAWRNKQGAIPCQHCLTRTDTHH